MVYKKVLVFFVLFFLTVRLFAFSDEVTAYYSALENGRKNIPISKFGFSYSLNGSLGIFALPEEKDPATGVDGFQDYYGNLVTSFGYRSKRVILFTSFYNEYTDKKILHVIDSYMNMGYDRNSARSWFWHRSPIFLYNYSFIYTPEIGSWIPNIRLGKQWLNYSPYTLYRTFGLEGLRLYNEFPFWLLSFDVDYDTFFSVQKIHEKRTPLSTTTLSNIRELENEGKDFLRYIEACKLNFHSSLFLMDFHLIGLNYNAPGLRKDIEFEFKGEKKFANGFYVLGTYVFNKHREELMENAQTHTIEAVEKKGTLQNYGMGFQKGSFTINAIWQQVTPDFHPVDAVSWLKYPPFDDSVYGWISEQYRGVYSDEKSYLLHLIYSFLGIKLEARYMHSYFVSSAPYLWRKSNPLPKNQYLLDLSYVLWSMELTHHFEYNDEFLIGDDQSISHSPNYSTYLQIFWALSDNLSTTVKFTLNQKDVTSTTSLLYSEQTFYIQYKPNAHMTFELNYKNQNPSHQVPSYVFDLQDLRNQSWAMSHYFDLKMYWYL